MNCTESVVQIVVQIWWTLVNRGVIRNMSKRFGSKVIFYVNYDEAARRTETTVNGQFTPMREILD